MTSTADVERHRRAAERIRQTAAHMTDPSIQAQLAMIANTYELLAQQIATLLASPKAPPDASPDDANRPHSS